MTDNMTDVVEGEELYDEQAFEDGADEIPVEGLQEDFGAGQTDESATQELEAMKKKLKEMEEEAARLKALQAGGAPADGAGTSGTPEPGSKEEADARSIYVGNVDYSCTPEELQQHFQSCGTVNRVTILTDKFGNPKGFAYVEFLEVDAVGNAVLLDNTEVRGRQIKVVQKRTNVPGLKIRGRGRGRGGFAPYGGRGGYAAPYGGGYGGFAGRGRGGFAPRGRGRGRFYSPY